MATYAGNAPLDCDSNTAPTRAKITPTADVAAAESNGSATANTAKFTVTITPTDRPQHRTLNVNFTVSGTATRGVDYTISCSTSCPTTGKRDTITIGPTPQTSADITITPISDTVFDPGETVIIELNLTDPQGTAYYLRDHINKTATATIADHAPLRVEAFAADASATEGGDTGNYTVLRNSDKTKAMTVHFSLTGDAVKGTDYTDPGSSVVIPAGKDRATVTIATRQDSAMEGTETVAIDITSFQLDGGAANAPPHAISDGATIAILDDDIPTVKVTATATQVTEGAAAGSTPGFRFERSSSNGELIARYTVSGSAIAGTDYTALSGEVHFPDGHSNRVVSLATLQDNVAEPVETVTVQLSAGGSDFVVGLPTQATISIVDDDQPTVTLTVARENGFEKLDGKAVPASFNLTRSSAGLAAALSVSISVVGTATSGADYNPIPATVTFAPGKSLVFLNVTPIDDSAPEAAETVTITVQSGSYAIAAPGTGRVFINDDDGLPAGQDGDSIPTSRDNCPSATNQDQLDSDNDDVGDACDGDDDGDGLTDDEERVRGTSPTAADSDQDGLSDPAEVAAGTDPLDRFSPDYRARDVKLNVTGKGVEVSWEAPPASRAERFQVWRLSDPTLLAVIPAVPGQVLYTYDDTGFPGGLHTYYVQAKLPGEEDVAFDAAAATASEPLEADLCEVRTDDKDDDGLCDAREQQIGTNLFAKDSDGDGVEDADEVEAGTDPLTTSDDSGGDGDNPFGEPLLWLGLVLLALMVAGAIVGLVFYGRRPS